MSRLPFELQLALRYLRPKRTFVSAITLISVVGVALGVAVLIIVISVMSGFDRQLRDKILGFNSHLKISGADEILTDYHSVEKLLAGNPKIKGIAPYVFTQVLVETHPADGDSRGGSPFVRGIDPALESKVSVLPSSIISGQFDVRGNGVLVGVEFAYKMHVRVGDYMDVYSLYSFRKWRESSKKSKSEELPLPDEFEIRGIFDVGHYEFNERWIVSSLKNAQQLNGMQTNVHGLLLTLHDPYQAGPVQQEIEKLLGPEYKVTTWMEENSGILDALVVEKNVMFYLLFFIMVVAAFGITSVLITFVVQKTREIGALKALGATSGQVMWLFLSQSLMVGVLGVITGFSLGLAGVHYRNEFLRFMRRATGFELFPASIYNFSELPALIVPGDIAIICGGSLIICILAGVIPAWNAGRLKPVEALRHE